MPDPKYLRLAAAIREQIATGELRPGDRLPSTAELRAKYGFGNDTIRIAMMTLKGEGLIVTGQGDGRWVFPGPPNRLESDLDETTP